MPNTTPVSRGRRRLLQTVGGTLAAAVAAPSTGALAQHAAHPAPAKPAKGAAPAATAPAFPRALNDHERATLEALADQIVPGSRAAGAPALLDRVLAVEPPDTLRRFRNAIGAFEREARMRHERTWLALSPEQRLAILNEAASAPPAVAPMPGWRPGDPVIRPMPPRTSPPTLRDHLDELRDGVARAFYATETGSKELGWTGEEVFEKLPECK